MFSYAANPGTSAGPVVLHQPPVITVRRFEYYMNGLLTMSLYLKEPYQQCSRSSKETGFRTDWHGEWHTFSNNTIVALFGHQGRADQRKRAVNYGNMQHWQQCQLWSGRRTRRYTRIERGSKLA